MTTPTKKELQKMFGRSWSSGGETPCGQGSTLGNTVEMREGLRDFIVKYGVDKIRDCGCGDFHWMKEMILYGIDYKGYDIVDRKRRDFPFEVKDVITEPIDECDLIICKDVFIHWTNEMIMDAIANFRDYGQYLFAESTPGITNADRMTTGGGFSRVNLEALPFNLGEPMEVIHDKKFRRYYGWWDLNP